MQCTTTINEYILNYQYLNFIVIFIIRSIIIMWLCKKRSFALKTFAIQIVLHAVDFSSAKDSRQFLSYCSCALQQKKIKETKKGIFVILIYQFRVYKISFNFYIKYIFDCAALACNVNKLCFKM